jgi:tryptophanyl-tRNA synthetase
MCDYLAVGIDPKKTTIFLQSQIPALFELTAYFMNLVTLARLEQNPTVKHEMKEKGFSRNVPAGFLAYPISQAADILAFDTDIVPVGADQLPMIEQANEIADKFNRVYGHAFKRVAPLLSDFSRLSGIDGKAKMSKTLGNAIYLSESPEELRRKVMMMYTDPGHIHVEDKGKVKGNTVFEYLDAFDSNKKEVEQLKKEYQRGGLGDVVLKKRLSDVLEVELSPLRARRAKYERDPKAVRAILGAGTKKARKVAEKVLFRAKKAMGITGLLA